MNINNFARACLPTCVRATLNRTLFRSATVHWQGNYPDWNAAAAQSSGYDHQEIVDRVFAAHNLVLSGQAVCERDSVVFHTPQYSWPALAGVLWAAARNGGRMHLLDFGGAFGGFYYLNRAFLISLPEVRWHVVEQLAFVEKGRKHFENGVVDFYATTEEAFAADPGIKTVFFGSVLQYLPEPFALLESILVDRVDTVIIDRTSFSSKELDRIAVQHIPSWIYRASYPCRFFSYDTFLRFFSDRGFRLIESFPALEGRLDSSYDWRGLILAR